ncbi:RsiV family protein [Aliarcobacter butzleri]|uniref:RsiV family protein n=1 Tax=Aliarcobacter butzleri TaxID=28197 RepID=UPI00263CCACE|nr:RsiV family protein [Aliarcobacter butzleri]MDN5049007.1 RsiV family protein [Aliarcobacter butzleri]MDN5056003.1 RsiV family protein [Aliarcobacter butzleri]
MNLERISWIASIISAIIAVITLILTKDTGNQNIIGNQNIVGNNNTIINEKKSISELIRRESKIEQVLYPVSRIGHKISFPQFKENIPSVQIQKINELIKKKILEIYEKNKFYSKVEITAEQTFNDFDLLGISVEIYLEELDAEIIRKNNIPEKEAIFLLWISGAHPLQKSTGFVVNLLNVEPYEFKDLFRINGLEKVTEIVKTILQEDDIYFDCSKKKINGYFDVSILKEFLGYESNNCFKTIRDDTNFYFTPSSLIIKYSRYEIGPGVIGAPEIEIPYSRIKQYVNPNGPLSFIK